LENFWGGWHCQGGVSEPASAEETGKKKDSLPPRRGYAWSTVTARGSRAQYCRVPKKIVGGGITYKENFDSQQGETTRKKKKLIPKRKYQGENKPEELDTPVCHDAAGGGSKVPQKAKKKSGRDSLHKHSKVKGGSTMTLQEGKKKVRVLTGRQRRFAFWGAHAAKDHWTTEREILRCEEKKPLARTIKRFFDQGNLSSKKDLKHNVGGGR